jgi:hypothetical protein
MEEVAAGSTVAACTPDVSTAAATAVACVRHIPSQAAQGADMPVVQVVRVIRSQVVPATATGEGIIVADMVRQRRWELLRSVARTMAATVTIVTMRTATGSVPANLIDLR